MKSVPALVGLCAFASALSPTAWAQSMDGTWFAGELCEELDFVLRIDGDHVTMQRIESGGSFNERAASGTLSATADEGLATIELHDEGRELRWRLLPSGEHPLAWEEEQDELMGLHRMIPVPEELLGDWVVANARPHRDEYRVIITAERYRQVGHRDDTLTLYGLAPDGDELLIATAASGRELEVRRLRPLPDGSWLVHEDCREDFEVFHRPGSVPDWLGEPEEVGDASSCQRAADHMLQCLRELCAEGPHPVCTEILDLEVAEFDPLGCDASQRLQAETMLEMSCEALLEPLVHIPETTEPTPTSVE